MHNPTKQISLRSRASVITENSRPHFARTFLWVKRSQITMPLMYPLVLLLSLSFTSISYAQSAPSIQVLFTYACTVTTVHQLSTTTCLQGQEPNTLIQSADGNFYGTTLFGGTGNQAAGNLFKITPAGKLSVLHTFVADANGNFLNGSGPSSLVEGNDGSLYGTASGGPTGNFSGVIFKLRKTGAFKIVSALPLGSVPTSLLLGRDGNFYGGTLGSSGAGGILFRVTPGGSFTVLHILNALSEGSTALGLTQASDGNFYGTTSLGGVHSTLFRLTPTGQFTVLKTLHYPQFPFSAPIQASNGKLYAGLTSVVSGGLPFPGMFRSGLLQGDFTLIPLPSPLALGDIQLSMVEASDGRIWSAVVSQTSHFPNGAAAAVSLDGTQVNTVTFNGTNGSGPAALVQGSDGRLFGVAGGGGSVPQGEVKRRGDFRHQSRTDSPGAC
jgi:uncharacterized repeat protein (TIGR03803 family)